MEAWGEMGDMNEDSFFDAPSDDISSSKLTSKPSTAANPFDDNGEPDFAGWLAAQAQKKPGGKPLPKGLAKTSTPLNGRPTVAARASTGNGGVGAKKAAVTTSKAQAKPLAAKKVDTAPKTADDEDGWGDGW